ncbi:8-oxo-dGTP diphosphatase MutT [Vibrio mangrovi]|uniref:8-oxo-dGTP diphosphatase n=1 Tax=Vibrio mangrovi TaxID=474394 RepID=A0A1Y6IW20_9VIBR|nr:8-oxo-dGTP diphosphatase MutT [Vibrio mangrovi]MDW6001730.1 8-oxo-dGTP diphosphatase MutT [Vibrio mangrovi]SMS00243.1 8-oxo-dGTP diphosphatase [Vibrio mangrovi]
MKRTHIVAAIIFNQEKSQVYITKRPDHLHKGGFWEFPGGKVEAGESTEQAISRELDEEIGIQIVAQQPYRHLTHDYPDKSLVFDFICISDFTGEPYGKEGQQGQWVHVADLTNYHFPEANEPIVEQVMREFSR